RGDRPVAPTVALRGPRCRALCPVLIFNRSARFQIASGLPQAAPSMTTSTDGAAAAAFLEGAPVPVLATEVDPASADFATNRDSMRALVEALQAALNTVQAGGGKAQVERHRSRGKLTARERIDRLTDTG